MHESRNCIIENAEHFFGPVCLEFCGIVAQVPDEINKMNFSENFAALEPTFY